MFIRPGTSLFTEYCEFVIGKGTAMGLKAAVKEIRLKSVETPKYHLILKSHVTCYEREGNVSWSQSATIWCLDQVTKMNWQNQPEISLGRFTEKKIEKHTSALLSLFYSFSCFFPWFWSYVFINFFLMNTKPSCDLDVHLVIVKMSQPKKGRHIARECI